jgi:type IV pilus assembly protein PilE
MKNYKLQQGVTLLELMIVAAVIGVIAAIAYPAYVDYVRDARRVEAYNGLMETAQKLERCFSVFGAYNNVGCDVINNGNANLLALPWLAAGTNAGEFVTQEGNYIIRFNTGIAPTATTFDLQAVPQGDQVNDACGTLTLDEVGQKGQTAGTVAECW